MFVILCVLCITVLSGLTSAQSQLQDLECAGNSSRSSPIKVFISGSTNKTGHIQTQVAVQQKVLLQAPETGKVSNEWTLAVDHSSVICNGIEASTTIVLTFSAPAPRVLPGYSLLPGLGYYKLHEELTPWGTARKICTDEGGHLLVIHSEKEAAAIYKLVPANPGDIWVGIYEYATDGNYLTIFGETANVETIGYMTWFRGEPNDKTVGNCLLFAVHAVVGYGYNDYLCNTNHKFICKQN